MKKNNYKKGVAPIIFAVIFILFVAGSAIYLKTKNNPVTMESILGGVSNADQTLSDLNIQNESMDISLGSLPALNVPSLDLGFTSLKAPKVGAVEKINVDVPFSTNDINIKTPDMSNFTPTISIPAGIPENINPPAGGTTNIPTTQAPTNIPTGPTGDAGGPPANIPTGPTGGEQGAPTGTQGGPDCSAFIGKMPDSSYCPPGPYQETCRKCFQ